MSDFQRREFFNFLLGGAALAATGATLSSTAATAAPFPVDATSSSMLDSSVEEAAVRTSCVWRRGRRVCYRRRVRRVCWWRRGRRICAWR